MTTDQSRVIENLLAQVGASGPFEMLPLRGGRNNRSARIECGGRPYFLKQYFRHSLDPRDRLKTEFEFLSFALANGITCVPRPLARDPEAGAGLYEYVEGAPVGAGVVTQKLIGQASDFFLRLNAVRSSAGARELGPASDAWFSIDRYVQSIERRLERIGAIEPSDAADERARSFVREKLRPAWARARDEGLRNAAAAGLSTAAELGVDFRCLSPADFGFHNAIRRSTGELVFVDLEYAGWDDPARALCDVFTQVAVPMPLEYFHRFRIGVREGIFSEWGASFDGRVATVLPLCHIKWCCIVLNHFLPVDSERKQFAGVAAENYPEVKERQLARAAELLSALDRKIQLARELLNQR